jgi:dipeptidyl aminopeptidase/acylaminoacyl peptidase
MRLEYVRFAAEAGDQEVILGWPDRRPAPGVLALHGHMSHCFHMLPWAWPLLQAGYAVCLPSLVGYGMSDGEPDYCGPRTCEAAVAALDLFRAEPALDGRIALWGVSRGAIVASQLVVRGCRVEAAVLQSGIYDLEQFYASPACVGRLRANIERETGGATAGALRERSAVHLARPGTIVAARTLVLHGAEDDVEQAEALATNLAQLGADHELRIVEGAGHALGLGAVADYVVPFLQRALPPEG